MPWRLGRPPLFRFDSTLRAVWPGTGVREKGKSVTRADSSAAVFAVSPVVVASALRDSGDRRRRPQNPAQTLRLPRFFSQHLPLRNFACALLHSPSTNSAPLHHLSSTICCMQNQLRLVVIRRLTSQKIYSTSCLGINRNPWPCLPSPPRSRSSSSRWRTFNNLKTLFHNSKDKLLS